MPDNADPSAPTAAARPGIPLGTLFGVEIHADVSVFVIFALVVASLGAGAFPTWHPQWPAVTRWGTAVIAGLLFFVSILIHELSHALVARWRGIAVPRITLFLFGGVSEMEKEPDTPGTELLVAIVGPLTSLVLGVAFGALGVWLSGSAFLDAATTDPERAVATLGPASTALLWLAPVNVFLGLFNLVPGFPLDGGRVLRAILWAGTGDVVRATRWASLSGQGFGWALVAWGAFRLVQGAVLGGIWLGLIGLFLTRGARAGYAQVVVRQVLAGRQVRDLMRTHFETVGAEVPIDRFLDEQVLRSGQTAWPVVDARGDFRGLVTFEAAVAVPADERRTHRVGELLHPDQVAVTPELDGREALQRLTSSRHDPLPVLDHGQLVGLLFGIDVMRWLIAHEREVGA